MGSEPSQKSSERAQLAAAWIEKLTSGEATEEDFSDVRAWIAADPANRIAYNKARAIWMAISSTTLRQTIAGAHPGIGRRRQVWPLHQYS